MEEKLTNILGEGASSRASINGRFSSDDGMSSGQSFEDRRKTFEQDVVLWRRDTA